MREKFTKKKRKYRKEKLKKENVSFGGEDKWKIYCEWNKYKRRNRRNQIKYIKIYEITRITDKNLFQTIIDYSRAKEEDKIIIKKESSKKSFCSDSFSCSLYHHSLHTTYDLVENE